MDTINNINITTANSNKKFRSKDEWLALVKQLRDSGLPITKFCKQNNIKKSSLYYWLNMQESIQQKHITNDTISFVRIVPKITHDKLATKVNIDDVASLPINNNICISIPNGISITIPNNYDISLLINIIKGIQ